MNKFDQLVEDLEKGKLTLNMIQIAIRTYIRRRHNLPEGIKVLLCGKGDSNPGLIHQMFKPIQQVIGAMELAYRRGKDDGEPEFCEYCHREKNCVCPICDNDE
jgi:hypothetical protein